ncbi:MAG TPA: acyloxyacyl hydrolase [Mucilaginibacter sp.]|jgi:hypothetical protein|nr:acyloxyacyl hydrolase [Mucilaginibacter sp.]
MNWRSVLVALLLFVSITCFAQNGQNSIAITPVLGLNINSPDNNQLKGSYYGAEFTWQLNMANNNTAWVHLLHVQDIGFTFSYFNLQNISLNAKSSSRGFLGSNFGVISCIDMAFLKAGKVTFLFSPGFGFLYATQTYYTTYNPIVGSHINLAVQAGLKAETLISKSTKIQAGLFFFHYSNTASKLPNDGINSLNASLGIVEDINSSGPVRQKATFRINNKHSFEFSLGVGQRGLVQAGQYINPQTGKPIILTDTAKQKSAASNLYLLGLYAGYNYRLSGLLSLKAGTDMVYYFKPFSYNNFYGTYQETGSSFDKLSIGLSLGTDVWLGRLAFTANYGYYLHYANPDSIHGYWIMGGKYYLNNWMALNAKIYIHQFEAHYANFGLSFNVF